MPRQAVDPYPLQNADEIGQPWFNGFDIAPDDEHELPFITRALYVGVSGDVNLLLHDGTPLLFRNAQQGAELGLRVRKILKSRTTADGLIGLY